MDPSSCPRCAISRHRQPLGPRYRIPTTCSAPSAHSALQWIFHGTRLYAVVDKKIKSVQDAIGLDPSSDSSEAATKIGREATSQVLRARVDDGITSSAASLDLHLRVCIKRRLEAHLFQIYRKPDSWGCSQLWETWQDLLFYRLLGPQMRTTKDICCMWKRRADETQLSEVLMILILLISGESQVLCKNKTVWIIECETKNLIESRIDWKA